MIQATPTILFGGSSTYLRPLSPSGFIKQLLCLSGAESFLPATNPLTSANPDTNAVGAIEAQSGGYLGEDDVVRLQYTYGQK